MSRLRPHRVLTGAVGVMALLLSACGTGDGSSARDPEVETASDAAADEPETEPEKADEPGETETAEDGEAAEAPADEPETTDELEAAELGTVTVAGSTYAITELRNCEPLEMAGLEGELELQGFGRADDDSRVQVDVSISGNAAGALHEVSWSGPEGVRGNQAMEAGGAWTDNMQTSLGSPPIELGDDRVSGAMPVLDAMTQDDPIDLAFDLEVPSELIACR